MGCFLKALPNVKSAYVTCKEFTPNLQIFYTFLIFGFDVQVSGLKLPQWNTFIEFGLNVQVSGVILPHWNGPFSQSFTQRQKRVCYYQKIYPRPPKNLHRLICRICDISQLCHRAGGMKLPFRACAEARWLDNDTSRAEEWRREFPILPPVFGPR